MTTAENTQTMDSIAKLGDAAVLKFATRCMAILERGDDVTIEDAEDFLEGFK